MTDKPLKTVATAVQVDKTSKTRTIYEATAWQILSRNFLAGMGSAMGGIFVYLSIAFVLGFLAYRTLAPQLQPLLSGYQQAVESLNKIGEMSENLGKQGENLNNALNFGELFN